MRKHFIIAVGAMLSVGSGAHAATFLVSPAGTGCPGGQQSGNLQACLNQAAANQQDDIILLSSGTYQNAQFTYNASGTQESHSLTVARNMRGGEAEAQFKNASLNFISNPGNDQSAIYTVRQLKMLNSRVSGKLRNATFNIESSSFSNFGSQVGNGAAVSLNFSGAGHATIVENDFVDNVAVGLGGALSIVNKGGSVQIKSNVFDGNQTLADFGKGGGAQIQLSGDATLEVDANLFLDNKSAKGGGFQIAGEAQSILISNNVLSKNFAVAGQAGPFPTPNPLTATPTPNPVPPTPNPVPETPNPTPAPSSRIGGGFSIDVTEGEVVVINNTLFANAAPVGGGMSLEVAGTSQEVFLFNNISFDNGGSSGRDIYLDEGFAETGDSVAVYVRNNLFQSLLSTCDGQGGHCTSQNGNINQDPAFVSPFTFNFALKSNSPAINMGTFNVPALPALDFLGNPRPSGGNPDMGAIEFQFPNL